MKWWFLLVLIQPIRPYERQTRLAKEPLIMVPLLGNDPSFPTYQIGVMPLYDSDVWCLYGGIEPQLKPYKSLVLPLYDRDMIGSA